MSQADCQFEIVSDEDGFRALQHEWDDLWSAANGQHGQSFSVCWLAWQHVAKPRGRRLCCIVHRENGQLAMVWPLVTYRRLLWTYLCPLSPEAGDYTRVLVTDSPASPALIAGAWQTALKRCGADFIKLPYVDEGSELHALASRERHVMIAARTVAAFAKLRDETEWDAFCKTLGTMSGKKPGALERRLSKEGELAVRLTESGDTSENAALVDWILARKRAWGDRVGKRGQWLDSSHYRDFLVSLVCPANGRAMARLFVITLDGAPIAATVVGVGATCVDGLIASFDARFAKFGPGSIVIEHVVKWAFDQRLNVDFGVGAERFKAYWSRNNVTGAWSAQIASSRWGVLAYRSKKTVRAIARPVARLSESLTGRKQNPSTFVPSDPGGKRSLDFPMNPS
jgi:CelD/BcsL family acetyltransferase involved in cellulose biosynthesis